METLEKIDIYSAVKGCHSIAWDTCHKIYILMDQQQTELMREYEYEVLIEARRYSPKSLQKILLSWYQRSCNLRFIQSVKTSNGESDFDDVVPQCTELIGFYVEGSKIICLDCSVTPAYRGKLEAAEATGYPDGFTCDDCSRVVVE